MLKEEIIILFPKSRRAKNRVREHGETFMLLKKEPGRILVESLGKTWAGGKEKWMGWFDKDEADWDMCKNIGEEEC